MRESNERGAVPAGRAPWEVARWGRLLAGTAALAFTALGLAHDPRWHLGTLALGLNLVAASLSDRCLLRDALLRLGAREREDLFLPGGAPRHEIPAARSGMARAQSGAAERSMP